MLRTSVECSRCYPSLVLLAAEGMTDLAIAERLGTTRVTVASWRNRFGEQRLAGRSDEPRPGAPRSRVDAVH